MLYFVADTSLKFYLGYQERLGQMKLLKEENERTKAALEVKSPVPVHGGGGCFGQPRVAHRRSPRSRRLSILANNGALGDVPEHLKPVMAIAGKNAKRLANLIDDLLDLQKNRIRRDGVPFRARQRERIGRRSG